MTADAAPRPSELAPSPPSQGDPLSQDDPLAEGRSPSQGGPLPPDGLQSEGAPPSDGDTLPGSDGEESSGPPPTWAQRAWPVILEWSIVLICAIGLAFVLRAFLVEVFVIPSGSMERTLLIDDRVVVYKLGYRFGDVSRGDVVVFRQPGQSDSADDLIKRVVAIGGDTFEIRDGLVYLDGRQIDEPYLRWPESTDPAGPIHGCVNPAERDRCVVPEGKLLVLGDNRWASRDSRYFGPIDEDTVVGRAFVKIWPPSSLGGV